MNDDYLTRLLAGSPNKDGILARGREVIRIEAEALALLERRLDGNFIEACEAIVGARRQLVVTGMGKSGHIARKIASTFAATGTPAIYVHPGEAAHGDLGMLVEGDVLLVLSNSGNTAELRAILRYAQRAGIQIIGVAARRNSLVIELADIALMLPGTREACAANLAPTTSTTLQLALGDALAMTVMDLRGVSRNDLSALHPGGMIGLASTPVREIMHHRNLPLVDSDAEMPAVISKMTSGGFGIAGVVDQAGRLVGIITDGDLRRHFAVLQSATAGSVMTHAPKVITAGAPAGDALRFLNDSQITAAFVFEEGFESGAAAPVGIIHIHDLLRFGLA